MKNNVRILGLQDHVKLERFLAPYKTCYMSLCSNLKSAGIKYKEEKLHGEYWASFEGWAGKIDGMLAHNWDGLVIICAPNVEILDNIAAEFKNNTNRPILGLAGIANQVDRAKIELNLLNKQFNVDRNVGVYELDLSSLQVRQIPMNFAVIAAKDAPKNLLIEWMKGYQVEALGIKQDANFEARAETRAEKLMGRECWVLMKNEIPVSLCGFNERLEDMVQIAPVWTPPEHRRQGLAKILMNNILIQEHKKGCNKAILFADNKAAIKVYEALNFKLIADYRLSLLETPLNISQESN